LGRYPALLLSGGHCESNTAPAVGTGQQLKPPRAILTAPLGAAAQISQAIRDGAEGFFRTQYGTITKMASALAVVIFVVYMFRPETPEQEAAGLTRCAALRSLRVTFSPSFSNSALSGHSKGWTRVRPCACPAATLSLTLRHTERPCFRFTLATITTLSFLLGAVCSAMSGYIGMWVSVRANVRVAGAARRTAREALQVALRAGGFSGLMVVGMTVLGVTVLFSVFYVCFAVGKSEGALHVADVPLLLVGYGFGASFVALFAQLGGGIYTKAADVGADLVRACGHPVTSIARRPLPMQSAWRSASPTLPHPTGDGSVRPRPPVRVTACATCRRRAAQRAGCSRHPSQPHSTPPPAG
jgi:hypothetical protein